MVYKINFRRLVSEFLKFSDKELEKEDKLEKELAAETEKARQMGKARYMFNKHKLEWSDVVRHFTSTVNPVIPFTDVVVED